MSKLYGVKDIKMNHESVAVWPFIVCHALPWLVFALSDSPPGKKLSLCLSEGETCLRAKKKGGELDIACKLPLWFSVLSQAWIHRLMFLHISIKTTHLWSHWGIDNIVDSSVIQSSHRLPILGDVLMLSCLSQSYIEHSGDWLMQPEVTPNGLSHSHTQT